MPAATRLGDTETGTCNMKKGCCPHTRTGTNEVVSSDVFINGQGAHRKGDTGPCNCPHSGTFESTGASSTVFINGRGATRIGDETVCQDCSQSGSHFSGSPNVFIGG
nr:MAG TPA: Baseplate wedge protein [Caudoviricetes sp.]